MGCDELRARAAELRAQGRSRAEIKRVLGLASDWRLTELLRGVVPESSALRGNAKDDLRDKARRCARKVARMPRSRPSWESPSRRCRCGCATCPGKDG
ncbi:hypothetical protein ACFXJ8_05530 [Nonomuraea sp. NPDC059194]|uniref:hypothetical protein n=1 Tax=Nonomuraea sp. NPDC059194 TaxID=3346764 RepID=UPI0036A13FE1